MDAILSFYLDGIYGACKTECEVAKLITLLRSGSEITWMAEDNGDSRPYSDSGTDEKIRKSLNIFLSGCGKIELMSFFEQIESLDDSRLEEVKVILEDKNVWGYCTNKRYILPLLLGFRLNGAFKNSSAQLPDISPALSILSLEESFVNNPDVKYIMSGRQYDSNEIIDIANKMEKLGNESTSTIIASLSEDTLHGAKFIRGCIQIALLFRDVMDISARCTDMGTRSYVMNYFSNTAYSSKYFMDILSPYFKRFLWGSNFVNAIDEITRPPPLELTEIQLNDDKINFIDTMRKFSSYYDAYFSNSDRYVLWSQMGKYDRRAVLGLRLDDANSEEMQRKLFLPGASTSNVPISSAAPLSPDALLYRKYNEPAACSDEGIAIGESDYIRHTNFRGNKNISPAWTSAALDEARRQGDSVVDPMATRLLTGSHIAGKPGKRGYVRMLDIADRLIEAPELFLAKGSQIRREIDELPEELKNYFDPQSVPEWVDADLLAISSRVWEDNRLAIISILYAAGLPNCYCMAKGMPALYNSGKLAQRKFIDQRVYESGLMLEAVMDSGGICVVNDAGIDGHPSKQRYMWGRGVVAARKIRMLHATMRHHLTHPSSGDNLPGRMTVVMPYDVATLGVPINQEDLAYTLLTFGYTIPHGLGILGCGLSQRENEAFLHTWRVVAHLMGVSSVLVPTTMQEASVLFDIIKGRQKAASAVGNLLTSSLTAFLGDYLPKALRPTLPPILIKTQLGAADASLILPSEASAQSAVMHFICSVGLRVLKMYFWISSLYRKYIPAIGDSLSNTFRMAGNAFVDSWRDDYQQTPFANSAMSQSSAWSDNQNFTGAELERVRLWRSRLFYTVVSGIFCVVIATILGGLYTIAVAARAIKFSFWLNQFEWTQVSIIGLIMAVSFFGGLKILQRSVEFQVMVRPMPVSPGPSSSITRLAERKMNGR